MELQTAKKIASDKCMELLGRDFCIENSKRSVGMYDIADGKVRLYVGIDDKTSNNDGLLVNEESCEFFADVTVELATGRITVSGFHCKETE